MRAHYLQERTMKLNTGKKPGFTKSAGKDVVKGLGKIAKEGATGVARELASIFNARAFRRRKRRY